MLQSFGHVRMAAIGIRSIEKSQALVMTIQQQVREALYAERSLVRVVAATDGSRSHRKTAGADSSAAENNRV